MTKSPAVLLLAATLFPFLAKPAAAQETGATADTPPMVRAAPLAGEIRLDGRLDEPAWEAAEVAGGFTQAYPDAGAPATQRTEARVLVGPDALYVGMRMFDTAPDSIAAQLTRRDQFGSYSDRALVFIDSRNDRRTGFTFAVNPRGVKQDTYLFDDGNEDGSWDAVWEVATAVDSLGWTAEFRIPFSQLRFSAADGEMTWGISFMRDLARRGERSTWAPWARNTPGFVSRFGYLRGLDGVRPPRRLELLPYTSARLERAPDEPGNPFYRANASGAGAGIDVNVGLPAGLTLTATVNPDFGQVEVDPAQINLSAFELFFPERRPFFTEGMDVFQFGTVRAFNTYGFERFFYSRRVGRTPQRVLSPAAFPAVDAPEQTTILGAAKVSGRTDGGWSVGLMNAVTAPERARFVTPDGERGTATVEPLSNYAVARLRRDLRDGGTVVGGIATAAHRDVSDPALEPLLRRAAYLGGADFEHRWDNRRWTLSGYAVASNVAGSRESIARAQSASSRYYARPDAAYLTLDTTRTSLSGTMAQVALQRSGDWDASLAYKQTSPGFEINDAGFQGRVDYRALTTFAGRRLPRQRGALREAGYYAFTYHAWNFGGDLILDGYAASGNAMLRSFWTAGATLTRTQAVMDDRLTRGGPIAGRPGGWQVNGDVGTDSRRPVRLVLAGSGSRGDDGGWSYEARPQVTLRPTTSVQVSAGPSLERRHDRRQYVTAFADPAAEATFGRRIVFADLDQTTAAANLRLDWTFSPTLSFQLFAQPYVSAGAYDRLKEFTTPGETSFAVYGEDRGTVCRYPATGAGGIYAIHPTGAVACPSQAPTSAEAAEQGLRLLGNPDFTFRSLRGNAVLRWEYRPGSALFVVWQQDRSGIHPYGDFQWSRDPGDLFREPARHVFLVKATYWIGS